MTLFTRQAGRPGPPVAQVFLGALEPGPRPRTYVLGLPNTATLVVGPSRYGKSSGIILPSMAEWPGPVVATSSKDDHVLATLRARRRRAGSQGEVHVYDPIGSFAHLRSSAWPPHTGCEDDSECQRRVSMIVDNLKPGASSDGEFFKLHATMLLRPTFHAAALDRRPFEDLLRWLGSIEALAEEALPILQAHGARLYTADLRSFLEMAAIETRADVLATARGAFAAIGSERALASTAREDIQLDHFLTTSSTLYVCGSDASQRAVAPLIALYIQRIVQRRYELAIEERNQRLRSATARVTPALPPLLLALDELAHIAPLDDLPAILGQGIANGVHTLVGVQSLAQLRERYGAERAEAILNACQVRVLFGGQFAQESEEVSRLIGDELVETVTSARQGWLGWATPTITHGSEYRRRLRPEQLRALPTGQAVCLYPGEQPFMVWTPPAATLASFQGVMGADPYDALFVTPPEGA